MGKNKINWPKVWDEFEKWYDTERYETDKNIRKSPNTTPLAETAYYKHIRKKIERLVNKQIRQLPE